jgi:hypothetical protein
MSQNPKLKTIINYTFSVINYNWEWFALVCVFVFVCVGGNGTKGMAHGRLYQGATAQSSILF